MRKSNLMKAMACLMAATMAVTCVPGVNVADGVTIVAEAAEQIDVPAPIADYNFADSKLADTSSRELGEITIPTDIADGAVKATEEGIQFSNGYVQLAKNLFSDLPDDTKGITTVITYKKHASDWPDLQWSEPLAAFGTSKSAAIKKSFRVQMNGNVGMHDNGKAIFYSGDGSWADGADAALDYTYEQWHTTVVTYNFAENQVIVYQDGREISDSKSEGHWEVKAKLSLDDFKTFKNNRIGNTSLNGIEGVDDWCMWAFATVSNFKVYGDVLTKDQVTAVTPSTPCIELSLAEDYKGTKWDAEAAKRNLKCSALTVPFKVGIEMTGEEENKPISDKVEPIIISTDTADAIEKASGAEEALKIFNEAQALTVATAEQATDGNTATVTITPNALTEGAAVAIKCGDKVKPVVYYFKTVEDFCESLTSDKNGFVADAGQPAVFTVTAKAASSGAVMTGYKINPATTNVTGAAITGVADIVEGSDTEDNKKGERSTSFIADIKEGENVFAFTCGEGELQKILTVTVTGRASSQGSSSGNTTPTPDDTQTPGTTTDGAIDPSQATDSAIDPSQPTDDAINTTPDDSKPDDTQTPGTTDTPETTEPDTDDTDDSNKGDSEKDDTDKKATKKKAKVVSVTAKKGKKTVSGTVKISSSGKKVSKAAVKVYVNGKKKATAKTKSSGKFSAKLSKKLKKGDKVKLVITKSTIKKITKTVTVTK